MQDNPQQSDTTERAPTLSVVMPVYNEMATLPEILARVAAVPIEKEVLIVDDGSTDGSREWLDAYVSESTSGQVRLFFHENNQGKAGALATGFKEARGDIVIIQDADLEYDPEEFPKVIQPIDMFAGTASLETMVLLEKK